MALEKIQKANDIKELTEEELKDPDYESVALTN